MGALAAGAGRAAAQALQGRAEARTGQPVIDVTFTDWNLAPSVTDATFVPKVPADYEGIAVVQRAAAVKRTRRRVAAGSGGTGAKK